MNFCENCGNKLEIGNRFCESCGLPIAQKEQQTLKDEHGIETQKEQQVVIGAQEEQQEDFIEQTNIVGNINTQNRKKKHGLIAACIILSVLVLGGGSYWWFNQKDKAPVTQSSKTSERTSSSTIEESTSTSTEQSSQSAFNKQEIDKLVNSTVGELPNKTSVFVSMIGEKNNDYENNGSTPIRSASIIKLFLMEAFYREVNEGTIRLDESYILKDTDKVGGTGVLQNYTEGTELTYQELARHMIVDSDNMAGNIVMNILGGPENITKLIHDQGFNDTRVERKFVDMAALAAGKDNYTSAVDVGNLLKKIYQREAVSPQYDQSMLEILKHNKNHSKLPKQIDPAITVYNKTGEYQEYGVQNDACIFETNDHACVAVVLSEDGNESEQVSAMNEFGQQLGELLGKEGK